MSSRDRRSSRDRGWRERDREDRYPRDERRSSRSHRYEDEDRSSRYESRHSSRSRGQERERDRDPDEPYESRHSSHREREGDDREGKRRRERDTDPASVEPRKKRKSSAWDEVPPEMNGLTQEEVVAHLAAQTAMAATMPAGMAPAPSPLASIFPASISGRNNAINTPFTQAKRLYIGNVPPSATEPELRDFFRDQFINAGFSSEASPTIVDVQIKYDRNFAFIEVEDADMATRGLGFDGIQFKGQTLKVRRPRDYQGPDDSAAPGFIPGIVSTNVPDSPNKVFVGGLPTELAEEQVKELISYFGELKAFHLVKDGTGSKGFAFFEFVDPSVTDNACRLLNGKELGNKTLLVQRAHLGSRNTANGQSYDMGNSESVLGCLLNLQSLVITTLHDNELDTPPEPTNVLVLMNMIALEDLAKSEEVAFLEQEVRNECGQFGPIKGVVIPSAPSEEEVDRVKGIGKIFVHFENVDDAQRAQRALAFRKYNHRSILTTYLEERLLLQGSYDGEEDAGTEEAFNRIQALCRKDNDNDNDNDYGSSQDYRSVPPPRM